MGEIKPMGEKEIDSLTEGASHYAPAVQEKLWQAKMEIRRLKCELSDALFAIGEVPRTAETDRADAAVAKLGEVRGLMKTHVRSFGFQSPRLEYVSVPDLRRAIFDAEKAGE